MEPLLDEFSVDEGPEAPWRSKPRAGKATFYWELDGDARREALQLGTVEEGYLAADINHGRRLISLGFQDQECPDLIPLDRPHHEAQEDFINRFSDTIARILAAAEWDGIDPAWLCERAQRTNSLTFEQSCDVARDRQSQQP